MKNLIFLDTETTGIDLLVDRLFQVAYKYNGKLYSQYFKPEVPISIKSMSITHVTNKMVEDKEEFRNSQMKKDLNALLRENTLVAHNALYDIAMLEKEGVEVSSYICTLKVARFLDENSEIPEYNLQYLRYFWELDVPVRKSHEAEDDVLVLEAVFGYLFSKMKEKYGDEEKTISQMVEISSKPSLFKIFNHGKHRGKKIEEVLSYDRSYLEWMLEQKLQSTFYDEDWIHTLKYYLKVR